MEDNDDKVSEEGRANQGGKDPDRSVVSSSESAEFFVEISATNNMDMEVDVEAVTVALAVVEGTMLGG